MDEHQQDEPQQQTEKKPYSPPEVQEIAVSAIPLMLRPDPRDQLHARVEQDFRYHPPTPEQVPVYESIRRRCRRLAHWLIDTVPAGREQSRALTALEDVAFNANAAIARGEPEETHEPSNMVRWARRELVRAGLYDQDADYGPGEIAECVLELVETFAGQGHGGGSHQLVIMLTEKLLRWKPLTPLTDDPAEWMEVSDQLWQSVRDPSAFSTDGGRSWYDVDDPARRTQRSMQAEGAQDGAGTGEVAP